MKRISLAVLSILFYTSLTLSQSTPSQLEQWSQWVKDRNPNLECSVVNAKPVCSWPGVLRYRLLDSGASFSLNGELQKKGTVELPSTNSLRPRDLRITTLAGETVSSHLSFKNKKLSVHLPKGSFLISGKLYWKDMPSELPIPSGYGVFTIDFAGKELKAERRGEKIWLGKKASENSIDSLNVSVFRRIKDDSPLYLETKLILNVSGDARPLDLGKVLPKEATPVSISSSLPNYLSAEGKLALQITPGQHEINILSLISQPVTSLTLPKETSPSWPKTEILSFKNNYSFRSVELQGASPVHADATKLPNNWKDGATYIAEKGASLSLKELQRGLEQASPNSIKVAREIWVDLESNGLTVRDIINGNMNSGFRLNALEETKLGRASNAGNPRLITKDPNNNLWGIEIRNAALDVEAISRYENTNTFSAVGWDTQASGLGGNLHLPPSWKLITILGANYIDNAWLDSWSLLQIFLSFLIILAAYKICNVRIAALACICLIINHAEFLAPQMLFVHLLLLLLWHQIILDKESPWLIACRVLILLTFAALFLEGLAFAKLQFTQMLFPQLHSGTRFRSLIQQLYVGIELTPLVWPVILMYLGLGIVWIYQVVHSDTIAKRIWKTITFGFIGLIISPFVALVISIQMPSSYSINQSYGRNSSYASQRVRKVASSFSDSYKMDLEKAGSKVTNKKMRNQALEKALASGPSIPRWNWRSHRFTVDSPVGPKAQLKIVTLSANVMRFVCGLRVLAILLLLCLLWRRISNIPKDLANSLSLISLPATSKSVIAIFLGLTALMHIEAEQAYAQFPSTELLTELEQKITQDRCQEQSCTVIENATIEILGNSFIIELNVSSKGRASITLPGPLSALVPEEVTLNGKTHYALRSSANGFLEISTVNGQNIIKARGALPSQNAFSLSFPQNPLFLSVKAPNWFVEGLDENGVVTENVRFTKSKDNNKQTRQSVKLPQWALVERFFEVSEGITIFTKVKRIGNPREGISLKVPLLENEKITSGGIKVSSEKAIINFSAGITEKTFSSILPIDKKKWSIVANTNKQLSESWHLSCSTSVHCKVSGLKPSQNLSDGIVRWSWKPFPTEKVTIEVEQLSTIAGDFITVDSVNHTIKWGTRLLEGTVNISLRVTQQTSLEFNLDDHSKIQDVVVNNISTGSGKSKSKGQVLLNPGSSNVTIRYQKDFSPSFLEYAPTFTMNVPAHNVTVSISPASRWLLWMGGPSWGPCVVFWGKLIVVVFACLVLARFKILAISSFTAILLGIGLSSLPVIMLWLPLVWLALLKLIPENCEFTKKIPQKVRLILFVGLSFLTLMFLYQIIRSGLVLQPPMLIAGNGSTYTNLKWYLDHAMSGESIKPWVFSTPISWWRTFSLIWAMWLVLALFKWMKQAVNILRKTIYPK